MVMVAESFGCKPSPRDRSILFQKEITFTKCFWIGALYVVMVAESVGCRPSPRDWFNLSQKINHICKIFMSLDRGSLCGNGR